MASVRIMNLSELMAHPSPVAGMPGGAKDLADSWEMMQKTAQEGNLHQVSQASPMSAPQLSLLVARGSQGRNIRAAVRRGRTWPVC